ncbi:hypothetical protein [Paenibacillus sp. FSL E2-0178]|uniref:hypothetical protein n=1 Tax=Paenibacillus sp. FSL E2-0178 TaxID=2921361 RepID=UPI0031592AEC
MNKYNDNYNLDMYQTAYHIHHFPDSQEREVIEYSTCAGCGEVITIFEIECGEILDIYGLSVHDERDCVKKAVEARIFTLTDNKGE